MFEMIHEFAVLGTACFMMALATVWYSPMLFGNIWMKEVGLTEDILEEKKSDMWKHMLLTFISYCVMLGLLSLVVVYAPLLSLEPWLVAVGLTAFVAAVGVPAVLFEGRSFRYYTIQTGFNILFIMFGVMILQYWPW